MRGFSRSLGRLRFGLGEDLVQRGEVAVGVAELGCSGEHLVCDVRRGEREAQFVGSARPFIGAGTRSRTGVLGSMENLKRG